MTLNSVIKKIKYYKQTLGVSCLKESFAAVNIFFTLMCALFKPFCFLFVLFIFYIHSIFSLLIAFSVAISIIIFLVIFKFAIAQIKILSLQFVKHSIVSTCFLSFFCHILCYSIFLFSYLYSCLHIWLAYVWGNQNKRRKYSGGWIIIPFV